MNKQDDNQTQEKATEVVDLEGEWKDKYLRALADYKNLERRSYEEKDEVRRFASEIILSKLLTVADSFGKAKEHLKDAGLDLAYKQLIGLFDELGLVRIDVLGKEFNPHEMECIEVVVGEEHKVVEEVVPGYRLRDKIIRVARVKVGKKVNTTN